MPSPCRGALPWVDPSESKRDNGSWVILDYFCCFMSTDSVSRHYVTMWHMVCRLFFSAPEILVTAPIRAPHPKLSCLEWCSGHASWHASINLASTEKAFFFCISWGKKTVEAIKPLEELGNPLGIPWEFVGNPLDALDRHTQRATESQWSWSSPSPPGRWLQVLEPLAASSWMAACCLGETVATVWTYSNRSCSKFEFKLLFIHDMSCSFTSSGTRSEMKTSSP